MKKIFTEPANPEEYYKLFTYGLALNPLDWRLHWWPDSTRNTIRRKTLFLRVTLNSDSVIVDCQPGIKESDSWYICEWKWIYLTNVHK